MGLNTEKGRTGAAVKTPGLVRHQYRLSSSRDSGPLESLGKLGDGRRTFRLVEAGRKSGDQPIDLVLAILTLFGRNLPRSAFRPTTHSLLEQQSYLGPIVTEVALGFRTG